MKRFSAIVGVLGGLAICLAAPVASARADDARDCVYATNPDRVIAACTAAIQMPKEDQPPALARINRAAYYMNRGHAYLELKKYDAVISDYTTAIELSPNNGRAYNNRGIAYDEMKDYDRAIADYAKAIELNPSDYRPYNNRGWAYQAKGDRESALADYRKALSLNPGDARIRANIESLGAQP